MVVERGRSREMHSPWSPDRDPPHAESGEIVKSQVLDRVLGSTRLPTLPAVALRVIELSSRPDVALRDVADTIQNDQALAARVLKTVNSSYYGLSKRCSTISQAMVALGLKTVKTIALGFSLIHAIGGEEDDGFDYIAYWKRCLLGATGASAAADAADIDPEEAFLAGLLQDVGALALHRALGEDYARVASAASEDHRLLAAAESGAFGVDHGEVGARLTDSWRLPDSLVEPIRYHERPDEAPEPYARAARCVALGAMASEVLSNPLDASRLAHFRERAQAWLGLDQQGADTLLATIEREARVQASLFRIEVGDLPDASELISRAQERLADLALDAQLQADRLTVQNQSLQRQSATDPLTGVSNKRAFQTRAAEAFGQARTRGESLAVLFLDIDFFKQVNDTLGHLAGDVVLKETARRLRQTVGARGELFRFGGEEFAALLPNVSLKKAEAVAEMLRVIVSSQPVDLSDARSEKPAVRVTVSVGVAALDDESRDAFVNIEQLINAADQGVYAAKKGGRDCVRSFRFGPNGHTRRAA